MVRFNGFNPFQLSVLQFAIANPWKTHLLPFSNSLQALHAFVLHEIEDKIPLKIECIDVFRMFPLITSVERRCALLWLSSVVASLFPLFLSLTIFCCSI